jgi:hypothetical protein
MFVPFAFRYRLWPSTIRIEIIVLVVSLVLGFTISWITAVAVALGGTYLVGCVVLGRYRSIKAFFDNPQNRGAFEERSFEFDEAEIRMSTIRNTRSQMPFGNLARIEEHPDRFLVFGTTAQSFLIPKSAFLSSSDMDRFREIARDHGVMK